MLLEMFGEHDEFPIYFYRLRLRLEGYAVDARNVYFNDPYGRQIFEPFVSDSWGPLAPCYLDEPALLEALLALLRLVGVQVDI